MIFLSFWTSFLGEMLRLYQEGGQGGTVHVVAKLVKMPLYSYLEKTTARGQLYYMKTNVNL
jgi:hypothetical protein